MPFLRLFSHDVLVAVVQVQKEKHWNGIRYYFRDTEIQLTDILNNNL